MHNPGRLGVELKGHSRIAFTWVEDASAFIPDVRSFLRQTIELNKILDPIDSENPLALGPVTPAVDIPRALVGKDPPRGHLSDGVFIPTKGVVGQPDLGTCRCCVAQLVEQLGFRRAEMDVDITVADPERPAEFRQRPG